MMAVFKTKQKKVISHIHVGCKIGQTKISDAQSVMSNFSNKYPLEGVLTDRLTWDALKPYSYW